MAATPDTGNLLAGQQAYNQWQFGTQLGAGRVNTQNPYGGQSWAVDPTTGQWTLNQTMSPEQQQLYQGGNQLAQQGLNAAQGFFNDPRNTQRIEYQGPNYQYEGGSRDAAEQALYRRGARYLDPQMQQSEAALNERLASQGFNINDPGALKQQDQFRQGKERAYADLRDQAITGGGAEATGELQRGLAAEGARTGFLRGERSDQVAMLNNMRAAGQPQPGWSPAQAQYSTPGMQGIDSMSPQIANWNAQQAAGANNQAGWWGLANNFMNTPYGQKAIGAGVNYLGGFFGA